MEDVNERLASHGLSVRESDNPDKKKNYNHEWYLKHRDEVLARSKKRYEEHKNAMQSGTRTINQSIYKRIQHECRKRFRTIWFTY